MDISAAALPPIQPVPSRSEREHPRFRDYQHYVASCGCKLITAMNFGLWLRETERTEWEAQNWEDHCFEVTKPGAALALGWWKHRFAPGHKLSNRFGPFRTRAEAEASGAA